jgi:hypothetical protein
MITKTIVVLANSWKKGGRCLAGKEIRRVGERIDGFAGWIRPVSGAHIESAGKSEGGQVTENEMIRALNRRELPLILEILEIPFSRSAGVPDQPENWEVAAGQPWRSLGMCPREFLPKMADTPAALWDTSGRGWSKVDEALPMDEGFASLYLVAPKGALIAEVGTRPKVSGGAEQKLFKNLNLTYAGLSHEFRISDPEFDAKYGGKFPSVGAGKEIFVMPKGTYVTVSLTPAYSVNGQPPRYHYKMAAAIVEPAT